MCGIAGWIGHLENDEEIAGQVMRCLDHRGPDAHGMKLWPMAALVHTRLSIIDLSPAGAQPMCNEDGSIWTVFNGELYNHHAVRDMLESRGHIFRGHSDTEVIPHLYEEFGNDFVKKLRGMFAIAVYDNRHHTLALARDRFGIKPLYYAETDQCLAFGSEIQALKGIPRIDTSPNPQALFDFIGLSYIPAPDTFYCGIRALQPGEILSAQYSPEGLEWKVEEYHQWVSAPDLGLTMEQAVAKTDALLNTSISQQIESDVPLGALLSGGIDSSLVSVGAQAAIPNKLRTFNVRFADRQYDETWAALAVAERIQCDHTTLDMDEFKGSWDYVTGLLRHAGQPFADTSLFPTNAVSRLMRRHVTVALSGDGGDEAFGGYTIFSSAPQLARLFAFPDALRSFGWSAVAQISTYLSALGMVSPSLPGHFRNLSHVDNVAALLQSYVCWIQPDEQDEICRDMASLPTSRHFSTRWKHELPAKTPIAERVFAQATEVQTRLVMPNSFLFKVDIASMKESLEVRVPLLDEDLFAFSLTIPGHLKAIGRSPKAVLRQLASQKLPRQVADKPKQGFVIPIDRWVDKEFKERLRAELLSPRSPLAGLFDRKTFGPIIEAFALDKQLPWLDRDGLCRRMIMYLAIHEALAPT